jgi:hypothetical protein
MESISLSNKSILIGLLNCGRKISIIDPLTANSDLSLTIEVLSYPNLISKNRILSISSLFFLKL